MQHKQQITFFLNEAIMSSLPKRDLQREETETSCRAEFSIGSLGQLNWQDVEAYGFKLALTF